MHIARLFGVVALLGAVAAAQVAGAPSDELPVAPSTSSNSTSSNAISSDQVSSSRSMNTEAAGLPSAPSTTQHAMQQERFRAQLAQAPDQPQRLSAGDKFNIFMEQTHSPFTFAAAGVSSGLSQATNSDPGFGQGWAAYGHRYGAALADSETSAFFSKFLIPVLARQDPRFKRNGREAFLPRLFDAMSQVVDTVDDDGDPAFNYSQVLGTVVSSSIANIYYPPQSRGFKRTANRAVNGLAGAAGANVLREFWPDIKRMLVRHKSTASEVEALRWRTGSQPSIVPEGR